MLTTHNLKYDQNKLKNQIIYQVFSKLSYMTTEFQKH